MNPLPNNVFQRSSIDAAIYGFERVWYTWGPATLPAGITPVFDVSNWNPTSTVSKICTLDRIAVTQNSGVQLLWTYDGKQSNSSQGWTDAFPSGLRPYKLNAQAAKRLTLAINNTTGSSISNFQLNYAVSVKVLSVAEELLYGFALSEEDIRVVSSLDHVSQGRQQVTAMSEIKDLLQKGTLPIAWVRTYDALFANRIMPDDTSAIPFHLTIPAGGAGTTSTTYNIRVESGMVYVVHGIALEGAPSVILYVDRDSNYQYVTVNGPAFAQSDDQPWDVWIPFQSHLSVYYATPSALSSPATFPGRLEIARYKMSDLLGLRLRLTNSPATSYAKVRAGLQ